MSNSFMFVPFFIDKPQIIIPQEVSISVFIAFIVYHALEHLGNYSNIILDCDELSFVENVWVRSLCMNGCSY